MEKPWRKTIENIHWYWYHFEVINYTNYLWLLMPLINFRIRIVIQKLAFCRFYSSKYKMELFIYRLCCFTLLIFCRLVWWGHMPKCSSFNPHCLFSCNFPIRISYIPPYQMRHRSNWNRSPCLLVRCLLACLEVEN